MLNIFGDRKESEEEKPRQERWDGDAMPLEPILTPSPLAPIADGGEPEAEEPGATEEIEIEDNGGSEEETDVGDEVDDAPETEGPNDGETENISEEDLEELPYIEDESSDIEGGGEQTELDTDSQPVAEAEGVGNNSASTSESAEGNQESAGDTDNISNSDSESETEPESASTNSEPESEPETEPEGASTNSEPESEPEGEAESTSNNSEPESESESETEPEGASTNSEPESESEPETEPEGASNNESDEESEDAVADLDLAKPKVKFDRGTFKVGATGQVDFDFVFDGGSYKGQLAIVNMQGMDEFEFGSPEFVREAISRGLSGSRLGVRIIDDISEAARFTSAENSGSYSGVKTFSMNPGDEFFVMLVPNGTLEQLADNPTARGALRPLFSLATANPNDAYHIGQIADITGDGNAFAMEDLRADRWTDRDYNDLIFQVRGATGRADLMDNLVDPAKDWRQSNLGKGLIEYVKAYITPEEAPETEVGEIAVSEPEGSEDVGLAEDEAATEEAQPETETEEAEDTEGRGDSRIAPTEEIADEIAEENSEPENPEDTESRGDSRIAPTEEIADEIAEENSEPENAEDAEFRGDSRIAPTEEITDEIAEGNSEPENAEDAEFRGDSRIAPTEEITDEIAEGNSEPENAEDAEFRGDSRIAPKEEIADEIADVNSEPETTVYDEGTVYDIPEEDLIPIDFITPESEASDGADSADASDSADENDIPADEIIDAAEETSDSAEEGDLAADEPEQVAEETSEDSEENDLATDESEQVAEETSDSAEESDIAVEDSTDEAEEEPAPETEVAAESSEEPSEETAVVVENPSDVSDSVEEAEEPETVDEVVAFDNQPAPSLPGEVGQESPAETGDNLPADSPAIEEIEVVEEAPAETGDNSQSPSIASETVTPTEYSEPGSESPAEPSLPSAVLTSEASEDSVESESSEATFVEPLTPYSVEPPEQFHFPKASQPLIGAIDTGFAGNNPDIDYSRITWGEDRVDGDTDPTLQAGEGNEHGTHVLGIIAAKQDNGIGIDGINNEAPIWAGRAVGSGKWAESLVEFVQQVRESEQPNAIVNLSLDLTQTNPDGSVTTRYEFTPQERAAIEYARQHNVLIVAAAGNDGGTMSVLGQASQEFDNIITAGSAERINDSVALSKAYDRADYSSYGQGLDIMAPGGTIEYPELSTSGDGVGTMAGTSVAAAKVTGAASQVWAANPDLSYRQVIELLKSTATDLKTPNWDAETGAGLLNMVAAVHLAKATEPETHEPEKLLIPTTWTGAGKVTPGERAVAEKFWQNNEYYDWVPYRIKRGDTLSAIALRTMGSASYSHYQWIAQHNGIANPDYIVTGDVIDIPQHIPNYEEQLKQQQQKEAEERRRQEEAASRLRGEAAIRQAHLQEGGQNGRLGAAQGQALDLGNGFLRQNFQNGYITWNGQKTSTYYIGTGKPIWRRWPLPNPEKLYNLGNLVESKTFNHSLGGWNKANKYSFKLDSKSDFNLNIGNYQLDLDVELLDSQGKAIYSSQKTGLQPESINLTLDPGNYTVRVYPKNANSLSLKGSNYSLSLGATSLYGSTAPWQVKFWDNKNLSGVPKWTKSEPPGELRFHAGTGAPPNTSRIPADNFSARWETTSDFEGGLYNFISQADDGVRVYIDGVKVIDKWQNQPFVRNDSYVLVPKGKHRIVVDYFENGGSAANNLRWEPSGLEKGWTGDLRPMGFDGGSVHSTYVNTYQRNGAMAKLGYPINNVHPWEDGYIQDFRGGAEGAGGIMKSNANDNSYWVGGKIWEKFLELGGAKYVGYPKTDAIPVQGGLDNSGGKVQHFRGAEGIPSKIWLSKHGAHPTWGAIGGKYEQLGGPKSFLGFPTSRELGIGSGWVKQYFEGGYALWHPQHGTTVYDTKAIEKLPPDSGNGSSSNWHGQYWNNKNLTGSPVWERYEDTGELRFHAGEGAPVGTRGIPEDDFAARWITTSYFDGGIYNFINQADDGVRVYVDGKLAIDKWNISGFEEKRAFAAVEPGYHQVMVEYFERGGGAANTLRWEQANPPQEWAVEYFRGRDLNANNLAGHRGGGTGAIDKYWGNGKEWGIPISSDNFSDRWTTTRYFDEPGIYELNTQSDDGIRVWVDDKLVIDKWHNQGFIGDHKALVSLDKGHHRIRVEHYEDKGGSGLKVDWQKVAGQPNRPYVTFGSPSGSSSLWGWSEPWTAEYFNNQDLQGAPVLTRTEGSTYQKGFDLNWGGGSPDSKVSKDEFSARWTTRRQLGAGTYKFKVGSDDGVRLYVNGEKIIDQWTDRAFETNETSITLPTGLHTLQVEYFERRGGAAAKLDWQYQGNGPTIAIAPEFQGAYNNLSNKLGASAVGVAVAPPEIQYQTVPAGSNGLAFMWLRQAGKFQEFRGTQGRGALLQKAGSPNATYTFGKLWEAYKQAGGPDKLGYPLSSQKDLGNGAQELELPGGKLFWAPGMTNPTYYQYANNSLTIPADSWRGEYFDNRNWAGDPLVVRQDGGSGSNLDKYWNSSQSPAPGLPKDNFSVLWTSNRPFDRGTYRFKGEHDDGFVVDVNGQKPINNMKEVATRTTGYGTFTDSRQYPIEVKHREYGGGARAKLEIEKASSYVVGLDDNNNPSVELPGAFQKHGGYDRVGLPTNDVHLWGNGYVQDFDGGSNGRGILMRRHHTTVFYYVHGKIWDAYLARGGAEGQLGYPIGDARDIGDGIIYQPFEHGYIQYKGNSVRAHTYNYKEFKGWAMPSVGVAHRHSPNLDHRTGGATGYRQWLTFDAWTHGDTVKDTQLGTSDDRWFRIKGTNTWVPSGYVFGNPEGLPSTGGGGGGGSGGVNNGGPITNYSQYLERLYGGSNGVITQKPSSSHNAIDSVHQGAYPHKVYSLTGGVVKYIGTDQHGGKFVRIWNEQLQRSFIYLHFNSFNSNLKTGQTINAGHYLGNEGWTGYTIPEGAAGRHTHVHVLRPNGTKENPLTALGRLSSGGSSPGSSNPGSSSPGGSNPGSSNPGSSNPSRSISGSLRGLYPIPYLIEQDSLKIGPEPLGTTWTFPTPGGMWVVTLEDLLFRAGVSVENPNDVQIGLENFHFWQQNNQRQAMLERLYFNIAPAWQGLVEWTLEIENGQMWAVATVGSLEIRFAPNGSLELIWENQGSRFKKGSLEIYSRHSYEFTGQVSFVPSIPKTVPVESLELIRNFILGVFNSGVDAVEAANEFLDQHPDLVQVMVGLAVAGGVIYLASILFTGFVSAFMAPQFLSILYALVSVAQQRA